MTRKALSEFELIHALKRYCPSGTDVVASIGDDTAVLPGDKNHYMLFTTDMLVENTHFRSGDDARAVGRKALACNISDIAAMGGLPTYAVISLGIHAKISSDYVKSVYQGIRSVAKRFGVSVVGGDTVRSPVVTLNVALMGRIRKKDLVLRNGARPGDLLCVTGKLGGSLKSGRHLTFVPCVKESQYLVCHAKPTAMMDLSDGLAADIARLTESSGAGVLLDASHIPCHPGVTVHNALYGGEDFQLLFTMRPPAYKRLMRNCPFKISVVGEILPKAYGRRIKDLRGKITSLEQKGYQHF